MQVADIDYVARAPDGKCVEDLVRKKLSELSAARFRWNRSLRNTGFRKENEDSACRLERVSKRKIRSPEIVPRIAEKKLHKRVKVHRVSSKADIHEEELPEEMEETGPERAPEKIFEKVTERIPERPAEKTSAAAERVEARTSVAKPAVMARAVPATRVTRGKAAAEKGPAVKVPGGEAVRVSPAPARQAPAPVSPEAIRFRPHVDALKGTLTARILDSDDKVIEEIAVRDLASRLKNYRDNVKSVVFDGVITQRLVDILLAMKSKPYRSKIGNILKFLQIWKF